MQYPGRNPCKGWFWEGCSRKMSEEIGIFEFWCLFWRVLLLWWSNTAYINMENPLVFPTFFFMVDFWRQRLNRWLEGALRRRNVPSSGCFIHPPTNYTSSEPTTNIPLLGDFVLLRHKNHWKKPPMTWLKWRCLCKGSDTPHTESDLPIHSLGL